LQEVNPIPGYDGLYGVIKIFKEGELKKLSGQRKKNNGGQHQLPMF
jgi:hypothetical protein